MRTISPDAASFTPAGGIPSSGTVTYTLILSPDGSSQISLQPSLLSLIGSPTVSLIELQPLIITYTVGAFTVMDMTNSLMSAFVDLEWPTNTTGPIVRDTATGDRYRIKVTSGVLGVDGPL